MVPVAGRTPGGVLAAVGWLSGPINARPRARSAFRRAADAPGCLPRQALSRTARTRAARSGGGRRARWWAMMGRYLLVENVADLLGISKRTVHELTRTRAIPCRRPAGARRYLFIPDELDAWIDGARLDVREL